MTSVTFTKEYTKQKPNHLVFVLDNDECLGSWSLASGIHILFSDYIQKNTGIPLTDCMKVLKDSLVKYYFPNGGARPGTKNTLQLMKFFKDNGLIDKVLMFTSATNTGDWVTFLKECLEQYAGVEGLYDTVLHRDNTTLHRADDGATLKCLDMVRKKINLQGGKTKIVIIDDRPQNVRGVGIRIPVSAYRHVVDECYLSDMIDEAFDNLQKIYKPIEGRKTYRPVLFKNSIKNAILVESSGRKKDIIENAMLHMCSSNQMDDTSLIENSAKAFINHIPLLKMNRSLSEHFQLIPPTLTRSTSNP
jgi:hypothetical protein